MVPEPRCIFGQQHNGVIRLARFIQDGAPAYWVGTDFKNYSQIALLVLDTVSNGHQDPLILHHWISGYEET